MFGRGLVAGVEGSFNHSQDLFFGSLIGPTSSNIQLDPLVAIATGQQRWKSWSKRSVTTQVTRLLFFPSGWFCFSFPVSKLSQGRAMCPLCPILIALNWAPCGRKLNICKTRSGAGAGGLWQGDGLRKLRKSADVRLCLPFPRLFANFWLRISQRSFWRSYGPLQVFKQILRCTSSAT